MSAVHKYYRKISENIDNIKNSIDIASLLVKSQEVDSKIEVNESNISDNLSLINTNKINISDNLTKINVIEENNLKISDEVFNDKYNIVNRSFNFNENIHSYQLFEKFIENNMTTGELIINTIINYKFDDLENYINRLTHLYEFFDDKNVLFYSITLDNHDFGVKSNSDKNILNINDNFCFNINNKNNIKLILSLTRINEWGTGSIDLQMIDDNYINIIFKEKTDISNKFDKNDKKIKSIKTNISDNLSLINTNSTTLSNIDTDLSNLRGRTNTHQDDIQKLNEKVYYLSDYYKLKDIIIIDIEKTSIAETIDINDHKFVIINSSLNNLKKDSYLQFDSSILIFFHKHRFFPYIIRIFQ